VSIFAGNPTGTAVVNLNGGTLRSSASGNLLNQNLDGVVVYPGGATFDTNGFNSSTTTNALIAPIGSGLGSIAITSPGTGYIAGRWSISAIRRARARPRGELRQTTGALTGITITSPGSNYSVAVITLVGGGPLTAATVGPVARLPTRHGRRDEDRQRRADDASGASNYGGPTKISGGTLSIPTLNNGGVPSTLGTSSSARRISCSTAARCNTPRLGATDPNFTITPARRPPSK